MMLNTALPIHPATNALTVASQKVNDLYMTLFRASFKSLQCSPTQFHHITICLPRPAIRRDARFGRSLALLKIRVALPNRDTWSNWSSPLLVILADRSARSRVRPSPLCGSTSHETDQIHRIVPQDCFSRTTHVHPAVLAGIEAVDQILRGGE